MASRKLVIVGLDAADHQLTQAFMRDGRMDRLAAMIRSGCFSRLTSVFPPQTAPAWTSITTGVNPGKHGIYYFYNFSTVPLTIINATDTNTPRVWDYVGAAQRGSVVVNVPITYPARPITGSMVSGIPPWFTDSRSVYPERLLARMGREHYEIDTPMSRSLEREPQELVRRLVETERRRVDFFLGLLSESEWSFAMVVLTALDRLQHKVLGKGEEGKKAVAKGYQEIDALVGRLIDSIGPDANYLVVSDHGFNERPVAFYPNVWLHEKGYLKRKSSLRRRFDRAAHDIFDGQFLWVPQAITKRYQGANPVVRTIEQVDLEKSRAFVPGTDGVVVVKSKEDQREIAAGLEGLRDETGQEVCKVYTSEQVYSGERLDSAPELLIVPRDDINIRSDPFARSTITKSGNFPRGNHGPNGVLFASGPDIKRSSLSDARLEDIAPTALALLGIRQGDEMDGSVLDVLLSTGETLERAAPQKDDQEYAFSEEDEKRVIDNLEHLGYT